MYIKVPKAAHDMSCKIVIEWDDNHPLTSLQIWHCKDIFEDVSKDVFSMSWAFKSRVTESALKEVYI